MRRHSRSIVSCKAAEEADTQWARAKGTPTFGQRSNGLKLDAEVVLVIKLGRVVDELNVANVDLTR